MSSLKKTFRHAFHGLGLFITSESNNRMHLFLSLLAIGGGFFFRITSYEWISILLCIGLVFSAEAFNTALERMLDAADSQPNSQIKRSKDIAAAAVLIAAITALAVALVIFLPRILAMVL